MNPFFSIGVTTYNRPEMLKECLVTILSQTFCDFEIIVGNDYVSEKVTPETLGISDPRIRFINHAKNLGEMRNMNSLLALSRGKYFSWLADDDLYAPEFLSSIYSALESNKFPLAVFTTYTTGENYRSAGIFPSEPETKLFTGKEVLRFYLEKKLKIIGCYGMFDSEYLKRIGSMEKLGQGFSPYSDNLLVVRSAALDRVAYIDMPLVFFRTHDGSISYTSPNLEAYQTAQKDFIAKSIDVLKQELLRDELSTHLLLLLKWCMNDYFWVMMRSGKIKIIKLTSYIMSFFFYAPMLGCRSLQLVPTIVRNSALLIKYSCVAFMKRMLLQYQQSRKSNFWRAGH